MESLILYFDKCPIVNRKDPAPPPVRGDIVRHNEIEKINTFYVREVQRG